MVAQACTIFSPYDLGRVRNAPCEPALVVHTLADRTTTESDEMCVGTSLNAAVTRTLDNDREEAAICSDRIG